MLWRTGSAFSSAAAHRYCIGHGLEIGGSASNPFRLDTLNVDFTDSMTTVFKLAEVKACGTAMPVDIVAPGDDLPVADESQDFVVSSHVLEHFTNPVKALLEWDRVVRPGGTIFLIVPHKDRTFDSASERTTLEHSIADYNSDCRTPHTDPGGHDHVWVTEDIVGMIHWMREHLGVSWEVLEVQDRDDKVGNGFAIAIRKHAPRVGATTGETA
jgi:ubiquinone/menaquinone biosynthesis C-methylase UbiE